MLDVDTPRWGGINHLALVTPDMDATVRFYVGVLGARVAAAVGSPEVRHYYFDVGPHCTVAFFEYANSEARCFAKRPGVPDARAPQFDHLALNLPDEAAVLALRDRLIAAGHEVSEVVDHGFVRSVQFTDPHGIALEASWWVRDVTGLPDWYEGEGLFGDPDPVPALRELREDGQLAS